MIVRSMPVKPLILVGAGWRSVIEAFYTSFRDNVPEVQRALLAFAPDVESAIVLLKDSTAQVPDGKP
jgi:hypothetical protein